MSMFSSALASGQLGPLMNQFGLPSEAVDAANKGGTTHNSYLSLFCKWNSIIWIHLRVCLCLKQLLCLLVDVEAFAKAMENSSEKTDESSDTKEKKDDDEDMSLD